VQRFFCLILFLKEKTIQNEKWVNNPNSFIILAHQLHPFFTSNFSIKNFIEMKLNQVLVFSTLIAFAAFSMTACGGPSFDNCAGQASCALPPIADNASAAVKKTRDDVAGKWKLFSMDIENTFHKTKSSPTNLRFSMCVSHEGGIIFYRNNQEPVCQFCYEVKNAGDTLKLSIDNSGLSEFCLQQLQTSQITINGNELSFFRQDSFITKKIVYKRTDENWAYKTN
jgi:hypothetical protein